MGYWREASNRAWTAAAKPLGLDSRDRVIVALLIQAAIACALWFVFGSSGLDSNLLGRALTAGMPFLFFPVVFLWNLLATIPAMDRALREELEQVTKSSSVTLSYRHQHPWFVDVEKRGAYGNDVVRLMVTTGRPIRGARCYVRQVFRYEEGVLSSSLNDDVRGTLGWPDGARSWQPRDIFSVDYVILFIHESGKLKLFVEENYGEFHQFSSAIAPGRYKFIIDLDAGEEALHDL